MSKIPWRVEYDNDVGHDDESYSCWWIVTNDDMQFETSTHADAEWLCMVLNKLEK